jgi:hypothetical protein
MDYVGKSELTKNTGYYIKLLIWQRMSKGDGQSE